MKKIFTFFILALSIGWQSALAVAPIPASSISVDPIVAEDGSPIKINALIYNPEKQTVTFTVEFKAGDVSLGKSISTISSLGAKTVSVGWKQPKIQTQITASIISALDGKKNEITSLHGLVGTISLGTEQVTGSVSAISLGEGKIGTVFSNLYNKVEVFRQKQLLYFEKLRDDAKQALGMQIKDDVIKKLSPIFAPPTTAPVIGTGSDQQDDLAFTKGDNPLEIYKSSNSKYYVNLMIGTVMASFFSSVMFFYAVCALVLFLLIRLVFKLFV